MQLGSWFLNKKRPRHFRHFERVTFDHYFIFPSFNDDFQKLSLFVKPDVTIERLYINTYFRWGNATVLLTGHHLRNCFLSWPVLFVKVAVSRDTLNAFPRTGLAAFANSANFRAGSFADARLSRKFRKFVFVSFGDYMSRRKRKKRAMCVDCDFYET